MPDKAARFISRLTHNTLALVLAGGRGSRLGVLTDWRTKPAVPFGGKFRIIDFTLSNCLNSGIRQICVLTQYKSHSLIQHLLQGWTHLNSEHGDFIDIIPAQQWLDDDQWYQGTADAVHQSLDIIEGYAPEYVLILAGDHIYGMDYGEMLAEHVESGANFTIACNAVHMAEASQFGNMQVDETGRIVDFEEKPETPKPMPDNPEMALGSMGIYVFSLGYLRDQLLRDAADETSSHDFGKDVIPYALAHGDHVQAYQFQGPTQEGSPYWRDVGTIDAYYQANMELISKNPPFDIYDRKWRILTSQPQLPPARFLGRGKGCGIENSIVSGGCEIEISKLYNSILFSNVKVYQGCRLEGVLALPGCEIGRGSKLKNVILDNQCRVPEGTVIGENAEDDKKRFIQSEAGIVVVNRKMLGQDDGYIPGVTN
ncbi:MAG: glucose-1-phosphate adenylyltransferase [Alphaproteobacteria bacterium]|nr:glucose-1-phosphate adenylyltransferase [Alphaproteobacteria bacterium]